MGSEMCIRDRRTHARLNALQAAYDGISVTLTAEVEQVRTSFYPGVVDAVLRVETVDGEAADFRVECTALPRCSAGERVRGTFAVSYTHLTLPTKRIV